MPTIHPNYIKASNLTLISLPLDIINLFLGTTPINAITIITLIVTMGFIVLIAYFIRQGYPWMKVALLILFIVGNIAGLPIWLNMLKNQPAAFIISMIQYAIQTWTVVLLFKIPKPLTEEGSEISESL